MVKSCCEPGVLQKLVAGTLSADLADGVMRHLEGCASCESMIESLESESGSSDSLLAGLKHAKAELDRISSEEAERVVQRVKAGLSTSGGRLADTNDALASLPLPQQIRDYELLESLGDGGMGMVYRARHTRLDRIVALKLIRPDRLSSENARERFDREMKAAGLLEHPNIVRALDAGDFADQHFLAMEYVDGVTLAHLVACEGPLPVGRCCQIIAQAAAGLQHIRESGLVHRDIKPSNLMWCAPLTGSAGAGRLKILDLGLALLSDDGADNGLTSHNQVMGTYDYIAPEQARRSHDVDIRADIYSLGCTFYFLLTGQPPFSTTSVAEKLVAHQLEAPAPVTELRPDVPAPVAAVVDRMMAKSPDDRFSAPADILAALQQVGENGYAASSAIPYPATLKRRQDGVLRKWLVTGLAILFAAMVAFAGRQITVSTPQGDVIIEWADAVPSEDVKIEVVGNDTVHIADSQNGWKITVAEGTYSAKLIGGTDQLQLKPDRVVVSRNEVERLSVRLQPRVPAPAFQPVLPEERKAARWAVSSGGRVACRDQAARFLGSGDPLPDAPLQVHAVDLTNASWEVSDLERLAALPNLDQLILGPPATETGVLPREDTGKLVSQALSQLARSQSLRVLTLRDLRPDDGYWSVLSNIENLKILVIAGAKTVSRSQLDATREQVQGLRVLSDVDQTLTDEALAGAIDELPDVSPDRRVARWVLSLGCEVNINHRTTEDIIDPSRLPDKPFRLTTVNLLGSRIRDEQLSRLDGLQHLQKIILGSLWGPTDLTAGAPGVLAACELPTLKQLLFNRVPLTDESVQAIGRIPTLFELRIKGTGITDACFPSLAKLSNLRQLYIEQTKVAGNGFTHLAGHDIISLYLVEAPLTDEAFLGMPAWPNLETLRVDGTSLSDKAIHSIARYPKLIDLGLNLLPNTTSEAWSVFEHLPALQRLRFRVNPQSVDDSLIPRLSNCTKLNHLDLEHCNVTDRGLTKLKGLPISYLDLRWCRQVTANGVLELRRLLPNCRIFSNVEGIRYDSRSPSDNR